MLNQLSREVNQSVQLLMNKLKNRVISVAQPYQHNISGKQTIYELHIKDLVTVNFPDYNTCRKGVDAFRDELEKFVNDLLKSLNKIQGSQNISMPQIPIPTVDEMMRSKDCQCISKTNPDVHTDKDNTPSASSSIIKKPDTYQNIKSEKNEYKTNDTFTKKDENKANDIFTKKDEKVQNDETKELSDADIEEIIERCLKRNPYSSLCDCFKYNFQGKTGKSINQDQLASRTDAELKDVESYNEYLQKVSDNIDRVQQKQLDEQFEYLEMAMLSDNVYKINERSKEDIDRLGYKAINDENNTGKVGNDVIDMLNAFNNEGLNDKGYDGFHAEIYYKEPNEYALSFRGSQKPTEDMRDWITNTSQQTGSDKYITQYNKAMELAKNLKANCKDCNISITGHSLGGGLASAAGVETGLPTYTFNAAGLHKNTVANYDRKIKNANITAYYSDDDILNRVQDKRYLDIVKDAATDNIITPVSSKVASVTGSERIGNIVGVGAGIVGTVLAADVAVGVYTGIDLLLLADASGMTKAELIGNISEIATTLNTHDAEAGAIAGEIVKDILKDPIKALKDLPQAAGKRINIGTTGKGHDMEGIVAFEKQKLERKKFELPMASERLKATLEGCRVFTAKFKLPE
ncbi:MAG: hypothetical protein LBK94_00300 [Prevotellaceae bacterium]|nr:hypothetical protein [Prevotellaceae bacterium]